MAASDGQVVFTVEMDDAAFQAGMRRLMTSLDLLSEQVRASLRLNAVQFAESYQSGVVWVQRLAAGVAASAALAAVVRAKTLDAAQAAHATASTGGSGIGQAMVEGMASGVTSRSGYLNAAVTRVVRAALAAARRAAGIASPSKLFRDELGQYLALGMTEGFNDGVQSSVLPAMGRGVAQAAQAGKRALEGQSAIGALEGSFAVLPPTQAAISGAVLRGSALTGMQAVRETQAAERVVNVTQHFTFEAAMQAPDEVARAIRRQTIYGLAGARQ